MGSTWFAVLAPPVALLLHQSVSYALTPWTCVHGQRFALHAVALAAIAIAAFGTAVAGWKIWTHAGERPGDLALGATRELFLARIAAALGALCLLAIGAQVLAMVFIDACQR
jgi:hypothetical protein